MPITIAEIERVRAAIARFIEASSAAVSDLEADAAEYDWVKDPNTHRLTMGSPATAATRRASMDLTRALARLRKSA